MKINWWPIKYKGVQFIVKVFLQYWNHMSTCEEKRTEHIKSVLVKTPTHDLHEDMKHSTTWVGKSSVSCHLFQWSYFPMDRISNDTETFRHSRPHFQFPWKFLGAFVYSVIHIPHPGCGKLLLDRCFGFEYPRDEESSTKCAITNDWWVSLSSGWSLTLGTSLWLVLMLSCIHKLLFQI